MSFICFAIHVTFINFVAGMKRRYFIWFAYDGSAYHGWQVQPMSNTVQAELQKAMSTILRESVEVVGAGRTDAGVHARMMAAHFETAVDFDISAFRHKLNRLLPKDISVSQIKPVTDDLHARFSAISRTYHYYIHLSKDPFRRNYSYELHYDLDFDAMNEAAEALKSYDDFGSFCKTHTDVKTTLCHVTDARWIQESPDVWYFTITANRFLRNMVRAVVGTLLDVGRRRITLEEFRQIIEKGSRTEAGESVPAHALFLEEVAYDGALPDGRHNDI